MSKTEVLQKECEGLVSGMNDKKAKDAVSGLPAMPMPKLLKTIKGHTRKAYYVSWSADNTHVASAGQEGFIMVTNVTTGLKKCAPVKCAFPHTAAINPSCTLLAGGGMDNKITITNIEGAVGLTTKEIADGHDGYISRCHWMEDKKLLTASGDGTAVLWDANGWKKVLEKGFVGHEMDIGDMAVPLDNKKVFATCGSDATCRLWEISTGKCVRVFKGPDGFNACAIFPNGGLIVGGCEDGSMHTFDIGSGTCVDSTASKKGKSVQAMTFSKSGRSVFAGLENGHLLMVDAFNLGDQKQVAGASMEGKAVCALDIAPDGSAMASSSYDSLVKIWTGP